MQAGLAVKFTESIGEPLAQGEAQLRRTKVDVGLDRDAAGICGPRAEVVHEGCCAPLSKRVLERPQEAAVERLQGVCVSCVHEDEGAAGVVPAEEGGRLGTPVDGSAFQKNDEVVLSGRLK